jgi:hypothetical protein
MTMSGLEITVGGDVDYGRNVQREHLPECGEAEIVKCRGEPGEISEAPFHEFVKATNARYDLVPQTVLRQIPGIVHHIQIPDLSLSGNRLEEPDLAGLPVRFK